MRFLLLTLSLLLCSLVVAKAAPPLSEDDQALNLNYDQFVLAFSQLEPQIIEKLYADNACYVSENQDKGIVEGRENILALYKAFFGKIRAKNAQIDIDFRVVNRQIEDKSATDVGYYLVRFYPAAETEEPVSEFAGKFVMMAKKRPDGKWHLTVDTNNRAEPSFYFSAKPSQNWYFGRQFSPLPPAAKHD
ncbi:YybH family protein [Shewanella salipaludis]|uniref:DUF4440 domain-containing protein n=1 Tax=Shewanella salipaludis TaxID=2723052 RepID=A0A972JLB1_9GAMM|nr:DUF4440 domain-containing protein [Shewanella salipaludis]NMH63891.1 DUF4440 domain-containing protein [Shewanella salipaludis]